MVGDYDIHDFTSSNNFMDFHAELARIIYLKRLKI